MISTWNIVHDLLQGLSLLCPRMTRRGNRHVNSTLEVKSVSIVLKKVEHTQRTMRLEPQLALSA